MVSPADMKKLLSVKQMEDLLEGKLKSYYQANYVSAVWCDEKQLEGIEIPNGGKVRLRTKGDGCFLGMETIFVCLYFCILICDTVLYSKYRGIWTILGIAHCLIE